MKKLAFCLLLITLAFTTTDLAQSKSRKSTKKATKTTSKTSQKTVYYISMARSMAGQFSKKEWQATANVIKRGGIAAFFADYESLPSSGQIRGDWLLVRINKRLSTPAVDALMLGPFSSRQAARAAVSKLPNLLSDDGYPLNESYEGEWSMGSYIIMGIRTK